MTNQPTPPAFSPLSPQQPAKKSKWYASKWFIAVAALFVGVGIGAAGSQGPARELEVAKAQISTLKGDLEGVRQEVSDLTAQVADAEGRVEQAEGRVEQAEDRADQAEVEARETVQAEFATRKAVLDDRKQELNATAKALDERERKVSGMERSWKANTIPGDGIFMVGSDIRPGLYKADGASSGNCYYARLRGATGGFNDIITNGNSSGPLAITVASSDVALELSGCGEFHKIG